MEQKIQKQKNTEQKIQKQNNLHKNNHLIKLFNYMILYMSIVLKNN